MTVGRNSWLYHASFDPYNTTEFMDWTWTDLVMDWTNSELQEYCEGRQSSTLLNGHFLTVSLDILYWDVIHSMSKRLGHCLFGYMKKTFSFVIHIIITITKAQKGEEF